ncbi:MAG: CotH kinase family protein [Candidatus Delongbacteria bacterium]|nr:CotH kinase family protein [Candidatus Delongbacteria bacterium]MBN2836799.1 CotH kinase family protein [Candidatus Delongbacteria bacterium]
MRNDGLAKYCGFFLISFIVLIFFNCDFKREDFEYPDNYDSYKTLFDKENLHHFEIVISQNEWDGLIEDMIKQKEMVGDFKMRTGNYRKADLIYNGPLGENLLIRDIGFRTRGNTTRTIPQDLYGDFHRAHFKIKFDETFDLDDSSDEYEVRSNRKFCTLKALNLKWNWNVDNSQIRELYSLDLMARGGINCAKTGSATLTIIIGNITKYFGVYTIIEPIDKTFVSKLYENDNGDLYECNSATLGVNSWADNIGVSKWEENYFPGYDKKTNKNENHEKLISFVEKINSLNDNDFENYLDDNFDVDNFIKYMAMNILIGNDDDYMLGSNNYYLYFPSKSDNKIQFIPHDFDKGLGRQSDLSFLIDTLNITNIPDRNILSSKILKTEKYRNLYYEYVRSFVDDENELFFNSDFRNRFDKLFYLYSDFLDNDMNEGEIMNSDEILRYMQNRITNVTDQLYRILRLEY